MPAFRAPCPCARTIANTSHDDSMNLVLVPYVNATLLDVNREHLRAGDYIVERIGESFADRSLAQHDHVLRTAHVFHDVHDRKRQGWHFFSLGLPLP